MVTCECREGECLHLRTHGCEALSLTHTWRTIQHPEVISQLVMQQQQQKVPTRNAAPQLPQGETFDDEDIWSSNI